MEYKCCGFLNHGIQFLHDKITVCSQVSHIGGGNIVLWESYKDKKMDIDEIIRKKKDILNYVKQGNVYPNCEGCTDLKDWNSENAPSDKLKLLMIQHWTKCNSNCIYCYTAKDKKWYNSFRHYKIMPILEEMLKKDELDKNGLANFSGGEFTLLDEADKIVKLLSKLNYFIIVNSSGVDYSRVLADRIKKGNSCVIISVDAGTEEVHRKIKRVKTYKKVWKNIKRYAENQAKPYLVNVKFIIVPGYNDTKEEIEQWLMNCVAAKVHVIVLGIDANYFEPNRENIPDRIFDLFRWTKDKAESLGLKFTIGNRALTMLTQGKYADPYWDNYRFDDGEYSVLYFQEHYLK